MAIQSPLGIKGISQGITETRKNVSASVATANSITKLVESRTKVSGDIFRRGSILRSRRLEASKRQEMEDEIEAGKLDVSTAQGAVTVAQRGSGGFLGRIMQAIAALGIGWLINNLPTWIAMGKEFIARIQRTGQILGGFVSNVISLLRGFGNVLGSLASNLSRFDLTDSSGKLQESFSELELTLGSMGDQLQEGFKMLMTPLGEGLVSGENAPATGSEAPDTLYPDVDSRGGAFQGPETSGGTVTPQQIYSYLRSKNISHIHALGIVANILGESGFRVDADEAGNGSKGIGLFQYTYPSRKQAFLRAVPNWRKDWKGQVDFAIHQDPNTPLYLRKQFSSPEEAADDFMRNWENPSKSVYTERRRKHNQFIKSFKPGSTQQSPKSGSQPTVVNAGPVQYTKGTWETGGGFNPSGAKDVYKRPVILSRSAAEAFAAMMRDSGGKVKGSDVASSQRSPAKNERVGGATRSKHLSGVALDIHGSSNAWIRKFGSKYGWYANDYSGTHGGHFEFRGPSTPTKPPAQTPAQVAAAPQQSQAQRLASATAAPERKGEQIYLVNSGTTQQPMMMGSNQPSDVGIQISEFDLVNRFMKNKLLLDLAYL